MFVRAGVADPRVLSCFHKLIRATFAATHLDGVCCSGGPRASVPYVCQLNHFFRCGVDASMAELPITVKQERVAAPTDQGRVDQSVPPRVIRGFPTACSQMWPTTYPARLTGFEPATCLSEFLQRVQVTANSCQYFYSFEQTALPNWATALQATQRGLAGSRFPPRTAPPLSSSRKSQVVVGGNEPGGLDESLNCTIPVC